jgi:uncharacterized protein YdeI (YjbR/CyaY-like superfamily)
MESTSKPTSDLPTRLFKSKKDWAAWLKKNHAASPGLWIRMAKKDSGTASVTYLEAVEVALCYGWIDGQKRPYDGSAWLQKFTPRGPRSIWSKINREKAQRLIKSGEMKAAGLKAIERAKQNGQWDQAYESPSRATVPDDFQEALNKNAKAKAFFATLNSPNRYAILFRIQTAKKAETRARRIEQFVGMLEKHETLYP